MDPPAPPEKWAQLLLLLVEPCGSRFSFPCYFKFLFLLPPWDAQSCLCLAVGTPGVCFLERSARIHSPTTQAVTSQIFPSFLTPHLQLLSHLHFHLFPAPQRSRMHFDFAASCTSNNNCLDSEFRIWPLFYFFCSFQEPSFNLKSLQMPWSKSLQPSRRCQIAPKLLGMRCFTSQKTL